VKNNRLLLGAFALVLLVTLIVVAGFLPSRTSSESGSSQVPESKSPPPSDLVEDTGSGASAPAVARATTSSGVSPVAAQQVAPVASAAPALPLLPPGNLPSASGVLSPILPGPASSSASSAQAVVTSASTAFGIYRTPAEILAGKDLSDPVQRAMAASEMTDAEEARYAAVLAKAEQMGIPVRLEGPSHSVSALYDIREEGPLYRKTLNTNAAISTGANLLNTAPYGLNGQGMTVGVWDAARARTNHVELIGKVTVGDSTTANDDHSTHVAGTIAAKGVDPKAKGMGTNTLIKTYDWNTDYAEMTAAGAATAGDSAKLPISNHSYGYNATAADMGRYETECNTIDALAVGLPYYLVFWAAGNEQDTLTTLGGYQSITFNGLAKNIMTVGAADDAVTAGVRDVSKGTLAYFSSMGPCDDGRIKPDIVANGVDLYSCVATGTNTYDGTYSGTSMATPNAVGTAALLEQLYKTNFAGQLMRASMLKALMIHCR